MIKAVITIRLGSITGLKWLSVLRFGKVYVMSPYPPTQSSSALLMGDIHKEGI